LKPPTAEQRFWSHFDDRANTWRDGGPDTACLAELTPPERDRVESGLLARLALKPGDDDWVPRALGELRSAKAEAPLRALLRSGWGTTRVAAAGALWKVCQDPAAVNVLVRILKRRSALGRLWFKAIGIDSARIDAAVALGGIDTPESRQALEDAQTDPDLLVRANAKRTLRGLKTGVFDPFAQMVEDGWVVVKNADGTTTYSPPDPKKAPP
jgi:HEAT repeat protein